MTYLISFGLPLVSPCFCVCDCKIFCLLSSVIVKSFASNIPISKLTRRILINQKKNDATLNTFKEQYLNLLHFIKLSKYFNCKWKILFFYHLFTLISPEHVGNVALHCPFRWHLTVADPLTIYPLVQVTVTWSG